MYEPTMHLLLRLQSLAGENCSLTDEEWEAIASEALGGSAPAQFIVATAFEKTGDKLRAEEWYVRAARQGYLPAVRLVRRGLVA
jgi:TPR repeat protein